ncbi:UDP-N-acetylmuramoylalanine--D-glutamate ligase [Microbacterium terrae]|uniref:UDP-N-acetylmuramoylalanine--D-glutamate ligase n=1 Tax=Microbacterium terrae TaxID=69369 RepID=A0A0M2H4K5_9MICO|nr:UDP-N-acetylmuramoyl-L-alanine--D-glutamate ligase [Microbacterium terrae]KJL41366.1 UDP-N-acetylmuramoylalanine--D-glutamate ligase [Microbacterium terrae]MBP1077595.1 UDP-N-acetylmuramoylalanine--D-glutamate ligase [Microbacterium terrae]GLJ99200.1 UDP-N-acetylmuramoylalanine--D-glutamate ligase [Microbacterium terrae]
MSAARLDSLTSWHADWTGLRVAVLGLSVTGFSVADTLAELGADVLVVTEKADEEYARLLPVIGARLWTGSLDAVPSELVDFAPEVIVASPGFSPQHPIVEWALAGDIALWGDIELAWRVRDKVVRAEGTPADWVLITGTNGKTTTTRLTATMLVAGGLRAAPVGNIGTPVLDAVRDPAGFDALVVELSSHQLWYLGLQRGPEPLSPHAAVCLNLADDHLEWHGSFEAYRDAKAHVYDNTRVACVYNKADAATMSMVEDADVVEGARAIGFDLGVPGPSDLGVVDGILVDRAFLDDRRTSALELTTVAELSELGLSAPHIATNILAAAALARSLGVEPASIRDALRGFRLDPHRIEVVGRHRGVTWVDDSKATNPHAAASSLTAYPGAVWIVGGLLKGVDLSSLVADRGVRTKAAIVIGVERDAVTAAFARHAPAVPVFEVDHAETEDVMARVVELAAGIARDGDVVLLAPAAASFDQFASYSDRGRRFAAAVQELIGTGDAGDVDRTADPSDPDR